ncbi:MAG: hypothetical protein M1840_004665 [Geoglossum simile]|nr:MAG: hypothetical protein M1840_004665 [Geoglossum simile]
MHPFRRIAEAGGIARVYATWSHFSMDWVICYGDSIFFRVPPWQDFLQRIPRICDTRQKKKALVDLMMHSLTFFLTLCAAYLASARRSGQHIWMRSLDSPRGLPAMPVTEPVARLHERRNYTSKYLTDKTKKFYVDGTSIPEVEFDVGESYAGLLPISPAKNESRKLFFWFFPTNDPLGQDEITIFLNGGPGCSSMEGLLKENGPFLWQTGTIKPVPNPWSWTNLTNMVWIDQPVGTGFSQGIPSAISEEDVSVQFLGFFKEFIDTFGFYGKNVYITGESYAGAYVPYIADAMFNANDTKYFNVQSTLIYDPIINTIPIQEQVPAVAFVNYWEPLFALNASFMADIRARADKCGYTSYLNDNLVFPPKGLLPPPPNATSRSCDVFFDILDAVFYVNPCFNFYKISDTCPLLWDVIGFPGSYPYLQDGAELYFNRSDVKRHINVPQDTSWSECALMPVFINRTDNSPPSGLSVLPSVIERSKRTVIAHGMLDMVLMSNGTLLAIQNMTWNGMQGFQSEPKEDFFVPYHVDTSISTIAGAGIMGTTHTERSLTWVTIQLSGHMVPEYAPSAAYRHLEFLLGRIDKLTQ